MICSDFTKKVQSGYVLLSSRKYDREHGGSLLLDEKNYVHGSMVLAEKYFQFNITLNNFYRNFNKLNNFKNFNKLKHCSITNNIPEDQKR